MQSNEWLNDPELKHIDKEKLELLQLLVFEGKNLPREKMMPFLLNASKRMKSGNIKFTDTEITQIIACIKKYASEEDLVQMNKILALFAAKEHR